VQLVVDADGLIKLNRAGVLRKVVETYSCVIPLAVYDEVVTEGKMRQHQDAEAIEASLAGRAEIAPRQARRVPDPGLGAGESAILELLPDIPKAVVISDDRRFLSQLSIEGVSFLTPADILVVMTRGGALSDAEAREALERLRPTIRTRAYWDAREDLEAIRRGSHEKD
jgi:hypothetical protein